LVELSESLARVLEDVIMINQSYAIDKFFLQVYDQYLVWGDFESHTHTHLIIERRRELRWTLFKEELVCMLYNWE
jgi:hypothetical protein